MVCAVCGAKAKRSTFNYLEWKQNRRRVCVNCAPLPRDTDYWSRHRKSAITNAIKG